MARSFEVYYQDRIGLRITEGSEQTCKGEAVGYEQEVKGGG
ncbi:MAG TPA: hypothetical protein VFD48_12800 [Pyrinomonadaceae bacterium]|nr:hypothetical protein [Pyrinomonadaceae bacterium]